MHGCERAGTKKDTHPVYNKIGSTSVLHSQQVKQGSGQLNSAGYGRKICEVY